MCGIPQPTMQGFEIQEKAAPSHSTQPEPTQPKGVEPHKYRAVNTRVNKGFLSTDILHVAMSKKTTLHNVDSFSATGFVKKKK